LSLNLAGAPSQLLSRRNPMRQTERQGEDMKQSEFRYRGNHQKHPPDPVVIEVVGNIRAEVEKHTKGVSAAVEYDDDANRYCITFALDGKVFVVMNYSSGFECAEVQEFGSCVSTMYYFEPLCLMEKAIVPFLSNLLKKERLRIGDLLSKLNA
jgi:hypothetical protein